MEGGKAQDCLVRLRSSSGWFSCSSSDFILVGMSIGSSGSRFVGRAEELGQLVAALEQVELGSPAVVLVAGDAGVGKTRLLAELADQAERRRVRVLVGGCMNVG